MLIPEYDHFVPGHSIEYRVQSHTVGQLKFDIYLNFSDNVGKLYCILAF